MNFLLTGAKPGMGGRFAWYTRMRIHRESRWRNQTQSSKFAVSRANCLREDQRAMNDCDKNIEEVLRWHSVGRQARRMSEVLRRFGDDHFSA